jgi:hypothetical protein
MNTPLCLEYDLTSSDNFFIQLTTKAHLKHFYYNRTRSPKQVVPRPAVIALDGTHNTLVTKNHTLVITESMDINHKYTPISLTFCSGENADSITRTLKNLEY